MFAPSVPTHPWNWTRQPYQNHRLSLDFRLDSDHPLASNVKPESPTTTAAFPLTHQADSAFPSMWLPGWTVLCICPPAGAFHYRDGVDEQGFPQPGSDWTSAVSPGLVEDPETEQKNATSINIVWKTMNA